MPTFQITGPDGKKYRVSGENAEGAMAALQKMGGQADQPSTLADVAKSGLSGLRQGAEGLAGSVGDLSHMAVEGTSWLAGKLGASPDTQAFIDKYGRYMSPTALMPTSAEVRNVGDKAFGGPAYEPKTTAGEYARTIGEFAPAALGGGESLVAKAANAVVPAVASETAGQLTEGTKAEPYARIVGALMGAPAVSIGRKAVTPFPASPERTAMADTLAKEGVDLTAGQRVGSDKLRYAESELGGFGGQNMMERQGEQFTKAALSKAGINADRATPEVMDRAFTDIGQKFDDLAANNHVAPDQKLIADLQQSGRDYFATTNESSRVPMVIDTLKDVAKDLQAGGLTGEKYKALTSRLEKVARGKNFSDPEAAHALRDIRSNLDDAMERSIATNNPNDLGAWKQARREYRNLLVLEKAASKGGENAAAGIISPSALRTATAQQSRRGYVRGQGDFADLARAGEGVMKPLPQSGTAPRTAARNLFSSVPAIMGGAGGYAAGGNPETAIIGALLGGTVPSAVGKAILSKPGKAYLANQLLRERPAISPAKRAIANALLAIESQRRPLEIGGADSSGG